MNNIRNQSTSVISEIIQLIICYAEDWGRLPSSTQHLMRQLSKKYTILWVDSLGLRAPSISKGDSKRILSKIKKFFKGIKEAEQNIFVLSPLVIPLYKYSLVRFINRQILKAYIRLFLRKHRFERFLQWSSCPSSAIMLNSLGELANIYYIGDEFSEFTQFDSDLVGHLEQRLLVGSDMLLVVSERLMETKSQFNALTFKLLHGCDYKHFSKTMKLSNDDIPSDIKNIPHPIIGYYGLIRDWFDFDMLKSIFQKRRDWSLLLIGPSDTDIYEIVNLPNVHSLGARPYESLPFYLKAFDVCLIPYRKTEITINANPLKLLEYLSSGKPVVTTDLPSAYQYQEGLLIGKTKSEIEGAIETAINNNSSEKRKIQITIAQQNSWSSRAELLDALFQKHLSPLISTGKKPVIMHLIAAMEIAGAERVVLNLLSQKHNCSLEMRVTSFVRTIDGSGTKFLKAASDTGVTTDRIPISLKWDPRDIMSLIRILKRHNVKLLHTHGYKADIVGLIAAKMAGIPLMATSHGYTATGSMLNRYEKLDRFLLRFFRNTISVSKNIRSMLIDAGVPENKILLIPNAVDFEYFSRPAEIDFRNEWRISPNELLIGTAGRLSSEKAQADLVKAFALIPEDIRGRCRMVIAGNGPERDSLLSLA
ncbi:MAG TPA: glycosyltransferase, partial [candidate division Zixibacteria bacterium]|nr:glycosyltransferase [candidate division Zixibacteria bacterium]